MVAERQNALAPWFGGKRTLAPRIIELAGEHRAWWEPFCGGVSILLQKPRAKQEVLNDLHGDLTNLAMVLVGNRAVDLYERAARTLYSEAVFDDCKAALMADRDFAFVESSEAIEARHVERAWRYLVLSWMGRNGAAGTARLNYQFTLRYTNNGGDSATRWRSVIESIPWWHDRLQGVVISRRDGIELLDKIDDAVSTVIYLDPPYLLEGDAYEHTFSTGAGGLFGGDDHDRLAAAAGRFERATVIVSYYEHPRLESLYPGWQKIDAMMTKALAAQNKRGANRTESPEVLLINREIAA